MYASSRSKRLQQILHRGDGLRIRNE